MRAEDDHDPRLPLIALQPRQPITSALQKLTYGLRARGIMKSASDSALPSRLVQVRPVPS
jgi:hypothetical protein